MTFFVYQFLEKGRLCWRRFLWTRPAHHSNSQKLSFCSGRTRYHSNSTLPFRRKTVFCLICLVERLKSLSLFTPWSTLGSLLWFEFIPKIKFPLNCTFSILVEIDNAWKNEICEGSMPVGPGGMKTSIGANAPTLA